MQLVPMLPRERLHTHKARDNVARAATDRHPGVAQLAKVRDHRPPRRRDCRPLATVALAALAVRVDASGGGGQVGCLADTLGGDAALKERAAAWFVTLEFFYYKR